jgi:MoxR-like ATPase
MINTGIFMDIQSITDQVSKHNTFIQNLEQEVHKNVVGQKNMLRSLLLGLIADGHILLEGLPGLAKTTAVKAFSDAIGLHFQRIQFTPDLLPADLLGTQIYNTSENKFEIQKGPLFANLILADEINRAPSKVQTALLEAMQERQITIANTTFPLEKPYLVLATQNPLEQEGTYPLPEAQVDRFMLKVIVEYPSANEELEILELVSSGNFSEISQVVQKEEILKAREVARSVYMDEKIKEYIVRLVSASRTPAEFGMPELQGLIEVGASPRASIALAQVARANAFVEGRGFVTPDDIKQVGMDVLRHRVILSFEAEAENITSEKIIQQLFDSVEVP